MGDQGTAISRCCRPATRLMQGTMPCVSEGTNWGGGGWVPVTSGRFHSEIKMTAGTKRRMTTSTKRTQRIHSGDRDNGVSLTDRRCSSEIWEHGQSVQLGRWPPPSLYSKA